MRPSSAPHPLRPLRRLRLLSSLRVAREAAVAGLVAVAAVAVAAMVGCRDLSGFSTTDGDSYQGVVVGAGFVLAGIMPNTKLCLTIDTDHLQDTPGAISTDDHMFGKTPMRPIPQIWHDPLSTLSFGEGRVKNLVYVTTPSTGNDVFIVVSLMQSGDIEVRLLRSAPSPTIEGGAPPAPQDNLFAVFALKRQDGPCSF